MSSLAVGQTDQQPARSPNRVLGIALALVALVAAIALLATNPHLLVALTSVWSPAGKPPVPPETVQVNVAVPDAPVVSVAVTVTS